MSITTRVSLPEDVYAAYERQVNGRTLEDLLAERLTRTVDVQSDKPFILTDSHRQRLEHLLGKNFNSPAALIDHIESKLTVRVGDVEVPLSPQLLQRLQSRALSEDFVPFLQRVVVRALQEYAGMR